MTDLYEWRAVIAAGVLALAWVIVTMINRLCVHSWGRVYAEGRPVFAYPTATRPFAHDHLLKCSKCGALKTYREQ